MTERNRHLKTCKRTSRIGVAMIVLGIVLMTIAHDAIATIGVILAFLGFFTFVVGRIYASQIKKCFCKDCGRKYDYEQDVAWEVVSEETRSSSNGASRTATVRVTCTCSNCGNEKTFNKKICVARVDSLGKTSYKNLDTELRSFFKIDNKPQTRPVASNVGTKVTTSNKEQLKELKEMLDEGLITEEDFEIKKNQILGL